MSSKEQYKDALKRERQIITNLKKEINDRDEIIRKLRAENFHNKIQLRESTPNRKKRWWEFWKIQK